jgi:hypothetical protein
VVREAGFEDLAIAWRCAVFEGAPGERKARKFGTEGVNILGHKPSR